MARPRPRRRLARSALRRGRPDAPVLDTTALVHEAYLKLFGATRVAAGDWGHFLGTATRAMRQVIVEHAPEHQRLLRVVECRFFAGYSDAETAEALAASPRTVEREWVRAKARLREAVDG